MTEGRRAGGRAAQRLACVVGAAVLAVSSGCQNREATPRIALQQVSFSELAGWDEDDLSAALPAARAACEVMLSGPAEAPVGPGGLAGLTKDWWSPCAALLAVPPNDEPLRNTLEALFVPFAVAGGSEGLFTGYFEPELQGAQEASADYPVPLYRQPAELVGVEVDGQRTFRPEPYFTRAEIESGALSGRDLELLWVADPIDAFFLQVQGSGRVKLADGGSVRVGYAANNGHPYTAIGRILVERGELTTETATMQTVRHWLREHPDEAPTLMRMNARYIFFRQIEGDGPVGSLGVALTPGRSLAIDASVLPLGVPMWLDTTYPPGTPEAGRPLRRLMVAQDTGGAIKGAVRGDIYWGSGEAALLYAGPMKQRGRYYLLLPASVADRMAGGP
jgi:membrane-bound lytic murein transglycosylase A